MSLNFFKDKTTKTDAALQFSSVLNDLKKVNMSSSPLDVDHFVKGACIHLEDQSLYEEVDQTRELPTHLETDKQYSVHDTRMLANTLLSMSETLPEAKQKVTDCREQVKLCLEKNIKAMEDMETIK